MMDEKQILRELAAQGGNKTRYFNHLRGWLDIEGTAELDELYRIVDGAPGKWNMTEDEFKDRVMRLSSHER